MAAREKPATPQRVFFGWLGLGLTAVAALALAIGGARWVWAADSSHENQKTLEEIVRQQADWIKAKDAVREREKEIAECIRRNPKTPEDCTRR